MSEAEVRYPYDIFAAKTSDMSRFYQGPEALCRLLITCRLLVVHRMHQGDGGHLISYVMERAHAPAPVRAVGRDAFHLPGGGKTFGGVGKW